MAESTDFLRDDQPPQRRFGKLALSAINALPDETFMSYIRNGDRVDLDETEDLAERVCTLEARLAALCQRFRPHNDEPTEPRGLDVSAR